jgi:ATP-dependent Clp protease ATP-binding subunit ClpA
MSELVSGGMGFAPCTVDKRQDDTDVDQKIYRTAVEAARRKFSPEFMNRIDKVVVFRSLKEDHLREILDLELRAVQERVMNSAGTEFLFQCSYTVKDTLLREGLDMRYGARHLKRSVERFLVSPLSNLVASEQVGFGDLIYIDLSPETGRFTFSKRSSGALVSDADDSAERPENDELPFGSVGILLPQKTQAASTYSN